MELEQVEALRRRVEKAVRAENYPEALTALGELERAQPAEGVWSKRIADIHRCSDQSGEEMHALARAADKYAAAGDVMKAIVMCKRMLDRDPNDAEVQARLSSLHPKLRAAGHPRPRVTSAPVRAQIEDGAPISEMSVAAVLGVESDEVLSTIPVFSESDVDDAFAAAVEPTEPTSPAEVIGTFPLTPFFAALREDSFKRLVGKLALRSVPGGERIFGQGDEGRSFFVISEGAVEVFVERPEHRLLGRLDEGEFFGEVALITDHPRMASARAVVDSVLIEIDRAAVSELIYEDPEVMTVLLWFLRDRLVDTLIRTNELFDCFPYEQRRALADRFHFLESRRPVTVIEQGQEARGLVVILSGSVHVVRTEGDERFELATLGPGEVCGEMSLLTSEPAVATVHSSGQFFALEISVADFKDLVAEHPDVLLSVEEIADRRREELAKKLEERDYSEGRLPLV